MQVHGGHGSHHGSLLAKLASVRKQSSELRALSSFLPPPDENDLVDAGMRGKQSLHSSSAQEMVERLQSDKQQLLIKSTAARLESAETERNALLDFLQGDMGNTAVLARRLELMEDDLQIARNSEATALQRLAEAEATARREKATAASLDQQIAAYQKALDEAQVDNELLRKDKMALDHQLPALREEVSQLRTQLRVANEHLGVSQPRLQQLEPELLRMRKEKNEWTIERSHLLEELGRLSPLAQILGDVETEFVDKSFVSIDHLPAVSAWSVGPELRRLCPRLYDYLRLMSQSLYRKEAEATEAMDARARAERELAAYKEEAEQKLSEYRIVLEKHENTVEQYMHQVAMYERELPEAQRAQATVAQIRSTLSTFPGGLKGLFQAISFDVDLAAAALAAAASKPGFMLAADDRSYGYGQEFDKQSSSRRVVAPSSSSSKPDGGHVLLPKRAAPGRAKLSADLVGDDQLPVVVGKALAHNFNAVSALKVWSIKANTCRPSVQLYAFASMIYTHTSIDAFIHSSFRKCADY